MRIHINQIMAASAVPGMSTWASRRCSWWRRRCRTRRRSLALRRGWPAGAWRKTRNRLRPPHEKIHFSWIIAVVGKQDQNFLLNYLLPNFLNLSIHSHKTCGMVCFQMSFGQFNVEKICRYLFFVCRLVFLLPISKKKNITFLIFNDHLSFLTFCP